MNELTDIKAIIFDMDGLLIDSEVIYHEVEGKMFGDLGITDKSYYSKFMGMRAYEVFMTIIDDFKLDSTPEELIKERNIHMIEGFHKCLQMMPFAKEVLEKYSNKYLLGLCTSSDRELAELALNKFGLKDYFKAIVTGDDITKGKPDPEIFLKGASLLGIEPASIIVLEDAPKGVEGAKNEGMKCFAVQNKDRKSVV